MYKSTFAFFDNFKYYKRSIIAFNINIWGHIIMVIIRMARGGFKNHPFYRIVVADRRCPRDGSFIEKIGFFNPLLSDKEKSLKIKLDRVNFWIKNGAQLSDSVSRLVKKQTQIQKQNN